MDWVSPWIIGIVLVAIFLVVLTGVPGEFSPKVMREEAIGAVAGVAAGLLFGVVAMLVQTAISSVLRSTYGDAAIDHGAPFLQPALIVPLTALGSFVGLLYAAARVLAPWLARTAGLPFAALMTAGVWPLFYTTYVRFSAVVLVTQSGTTPSGVVKTAKTAIDVAPPFVLAVLLVVLIFLEGMAINRLAELGARWLPELPRAVYVATAGLLGLPGLAIFVLLVLAAIGVSGGE